jgi:RNA polymerase sigma-70 factor (ECF subfamily)
MDEPDLTSSTLLGRLMRHPDDAEAWRRFVHRYGPPIRAWCKARRLQEADVDDISQDVLLRCRGAIVSQRYDRSRGRFRAYLRKIVENALNTFFEERRRQEATAAGEEALRLLDGLEARQDLLERLEKELDLEALEIARQRVRQRVEPTTWEVFRLLTEEKLTGPEVAQKMGLKVSSVYPIRHKVVSLLREELDQL